MTNSSQSIEYTYDATGRKLKKTFNGGDHYYMDGIEYPGTGLLFAMTEEGRVRKASTGNYTYDYFLKDHLGNIRVVLSSDGSQPASVYPAASMEPARTGLAETALSQLVSAMINPAGLNANGKAIATERLKAQGFEGDAGYRGMMNKLPNSDYANENNRPKAFMVWMLFDNEMKLVKTGKSSGAKQIPEGAGQVKQMVENEIVMDQGGFLTTYTVNESPASVNIDNFQLSVVAGKVLEINNYYPFGMLNDGITDPGISDPLNNYKYNGKELQKDLSLSLM